MLRINANTLVPSTAGLVVSAFVGSGKSFYYKLFENGVNMMSEVTAHMNKQIYNFLLAEKEKNEKIRDSTEVCRIISSVLMDEKTMKKNIFKPRRLLRNPGTKGG